MSNLPIVLLPFLTLLGTMIICLLLEAFNIAKKLTPIITTIGGFIALYSVILSRDTGRSFLFGNVNDFFDIEGTTGTIIIDDFFRFFAIVFLIVLVFVAISSSDYMKTEHNRVVYNALFILATIVKILIEAAN